MPAPFVKRRQRQHATRVAPVAQEVKAAAPAEVAEKTVVADVPKVKAKAPKKRAPTTKKSVPKDD